MLLLRHVPYTKCKLNWLSFTYFYYVLREYLDTQPNYRAYIAKAAAHFPWT